MPSAKLAAGMIKPSGYFNMDTREKWLEVMSEKPVEKISGIGDKIQLRLNNIGIHTIRDLQNADIFILRKEFKKVGWKKIEHKTSSESGERPGLTSFNFFKN
jgi:DNA polymerase-4